MKLGRYRIIKRIAVGGMAEIYQAETSNGKIIAIKKILPQHTSNEKFIKMFFDEAKIMISLRHPNIVQLYDFGRVDNDYFLALEWVEGKPLSSLIYQQKKQGVPFPPGLATYIMLEICCGLEYAHERKDSYNRRLGIVHRDISPPNILISVNGEVKIADFGIAKAASNVSLTNPGVLKGKYSYMSPEQASGMELDERSDIFSCGTMFYEMLASVRLFLGATDLETLNNVKAKRVRSISKVATNIPKKLDKVVMRALERKLFKRYSNVTDMANDLEDAYNMYYAADDANGLKGFLQFLYPRAAVVKDRNEKRSAIEYWSKQVDQLSNVTEPERSFSSWKVGLLIGVVLLALAGLFVYSAEVVDFFKGLFSGFSG